MTTANNSPVSLERLLCPGSVAIVGASARPGSIAANTIIQLLESGYPGSVYLVNPKYPELHGLPCYPDLNALPTAPDLVVYAISGLALESSFRQALALGVGGIVMFAANYLPGDTEPSLPDRLRRMAGDAGVPVCGGNSMGFYNYDDNVLVSFDQPPTRPAGHIALIAHSGSAMTYLANNDRRFCFNFVISSGQETHATVADYMEFVLGRPSTRVVALFLESVRDAPGFVSALEKAHRQNIPVVILKLGRTEKSAAHALSHSGAIVGDYDAFTALCKRHNAVLVRDIDELITTAMLFASGRRPPASSIAAILDSGGMREQMMDLAVDYGVTFSEPGADSREHMRQYLDHGLQPDNPLDAMGALGRNSEETFCECGKALLDQANTGLLTCEFEFRDGFSHYPEVFSALDDLYAYSPKPVIAINSTAYASLHNTAAELTHRGIPCINGINLALRSIRNLVAYSLEPGVVSTTDDYAAPWDKELLNRWRKALQEPGPREEHVSLGLLRQLGFPVMNHVKSNSGSELRAAAKELTYPVVLKSAAPGLLHKTDQGGVVTNIEDSKSLTAAYATMMQRLGPEVLVMRQAEGDMELALGMKRDPQYGPLVIVASGGTHIEETSDRTIALAPVCASEARNMIEQLSIYAQLKGSRGQPGADLDGITNLVVQFSQLVTDLAPFIVEMDINPVMVGTTGLDIVDALIVAG